MLLKALDTQLNALNDYEYIYVRIIHYKVDKSLYGHVGYMGIFNKKRNKIFI